MKRIAFTLNATLDFTGCDTLLLPVYENGQLPSACDFLDHDQQLSTLAAELHAAGDFSAKPGKTLMLMRPSQSTFSRVILVGLGEVDALSVKTYLEAVRAAAASVDNSGAQNVLNALVQVSPGGFDQAWSIYQNTQAFQQSVYDYAHESRGEHHPKDPKLNTVCYAADDNEAHQQAMAQGQATALGMALTQDLANMPSNFCTPSHLAQTALELGASYDFDTNILDREQMLKLGMGSFMAVAQGSATPPKMICLAYQGGAKDEAPIALVGKGVTFDTGGISLKPGAGMDEMKYDMGGAATVLGIFKALGELKPKLNVVGVIPATENMPSDSAIKPGDVVTSLSGQTIEILNTDAEGRLILCDALTYVQQTYQPAKVIDMATLTGACIIALGNHVSGLMANDQTLADELLACGQRTYDRLWQLPLGEEWDEQLKSNFADMANIGGRAGGTITAGQFLARFTKNVSWAHLDIAGTAWVSGDKKGATGRPVPTLVEYLLQQSARPAQ
jgi:leucyl aminopeptidase